ncbi:MAG: hypothetical protein Q9187_003025 [Circinaria calcarea]
MTPEVEQELTYVLLIELLSIETQNVLLVHKKVERLVEIGPSDTLIRMAEHTINNIHQTRDTALSIQRQLLCCQKHKNELYYHAEQVEDEQDPTSRTILETPPSPISGPAGYSAAAIGQAVSSSNRTVALVADSNPQVSDIVRTIVAEKLKKSTDKLSLSNTIKILAAGRSTLENELSGDLINEFGSLPERPEECGLDELSDWIKPSFTGRLGKQTSTLVARLMSTKMPGGFGVSAARSYLKGHWGLKEGRQDAVLLSAIMAQPNTRLATEKDARAFLDSIAQKHLTGAGISHEQPAVELAGQVLLDSASLNCVSEHQKDLSRRKLELYARSLNINLRAADKALNSSRKTQENLQVQLDLWNLEHGEFYASGIKPILKPLNVRIYDSFWNWALQDLFKMFYGILLGTLQSTDWDFERQFLHIVNASSPKLLDCMRYLISRCRVEQGSSYATAKKTIEHLLCRCEDGLARLPVFQSAWNSSAPRTIVGAHGKIETIEVPRSPVKKPEQFIDEGAADFGIPYYKQPWSVPLLHVKKRGAFGWEREERMSDAYLESLNRIKNIGVSFHEKNVLLTGAGSGSIGSELLQCLISGGAKVLVTTSNYSAETTQYFQNLYSQCGARGSQMILLPFNQGSQQDIKALIEYIYDSKKGLGWDLDIVIPFAAVSETDRAIDRIDSKSELAHRIMLTNTIRLLGAIKEQKQIRGYQTRPAQVILPLSANHGIFGNDGLYSESKMGLESLFNKWHSEQWGNYLSICGAAIGWTRGTGLMASNDMVAEGIENLGVRTFSQKEMAFNIIGLATPSMINLCQDEPLIADLSGGLDSISNLSRTVDEIRRNVNEVGNIRRVVAEETCIENSHIKNDHAPSIAQAVVLEPRANMLINFPALPDYNAEAGPLASQLKGMIDLEHVVVITGFSELGPYGNSRTRWEMEAHSKFSIEGCMEMSWIMGLIKYHSGTINGKQYSGWVDTKTGETVDDKDVKKRYEKYILEHSGIRIIEPEFWDGNDPHQTDILQEVAIQEDLEPFSASKETAEEFQRKHGHLAEIFEDPASGEWIVRIKKGAILMIPKAVQYGNVVAGQIPTGWTARTYGISDDIVSQVDPITLYTLVCTVEALLSAGITDFYEFYQYIHTSEVGNCIGSGIGGMDSLAEMFKGRYLGRPVQNDILQETFINTVGAWINMLLLSSSGPIKTPVGACATSIESLDSGCELIMSGKAKMCLVGGVDDLSEAVASEFANMKATVNVRDEFDRGRTPKEMSRPMTSSRNGFVEAHGCGLQVITTAELALEMGLPIYAIIAFTGTASDKLGRSIPAPGKGIVGCAAETSTAFPSPLLDINYRRRQFELRRMQINDIWALQLAWMYEEAENMKTTDVMFDVPTYMKEHIHHINQEAQRQEKEAMNSFGNHFWANDNRISPLRGALATWGLTIDDVSVTSFHGTSTIIGDKNEVEAVQQQLKSLGRKKGNMILGVTQKYLTGHPKGAAGAWMLNGCMQMLSSGLVPGNMNADNIDVSLNQFEHVVFPSTSIQTNGIKAFSLTSFGFGQKGAQLIGVHPKYLYATLDEHTYQSYQKRRQLREKKASRYFQNALITNTMFVAKDRPPHPEDPALTALLDRGARITKQSP